MQEPTIVLVVDDEPGVLGVASMHLQRRGYTVLLASSGLEALSVLENRVEISLVIADCDMPGISGPELDKMILARWPHIKVIAMSGRPRDPELPDEVEFLPKPFRGATLVATIEGVLNREPVQPWERAHPRGLSH
jgi:CheY-like chemotaxis protein